MIPFLSIKYLPPERGTATTVTDFRWYSINRTLDGGENTANATAAKSRGSLRKRGGSIMETKSGMTSQRKRNAYLIFYVVTTPVDCRSMLLTGASRIGSLKSCRLSSMLLLVRAGAVREQT